MNDDGDIRYQELVAENERLRAALALVSGCLLVETEMQEPWIPDAIYKLMPYDDKEPMRTSRSEKSLRDAYWKIKEDDERGDHD